MVEGVSWVVMNVVMVGEKGEGLVIVWGVEKCPLISVVGGTVR